MDVLLPSAAGFADGVTAVDNRAPPAARVLMMLCHLDAELETLRINETALVRRLEQARRDARAAHEEFRAQEIHVLFVESSPRYTAPPDALRRLRGWLEGASQRCRELAARAESAMSEAERDFDLIHRRMKALLERREALDPSSDLLRIYERSAWIGVSPRIVAAERGACSRCGASATPPGRRPPAVLRMPSHPVLATG